MGARVSPHRFALLALAGAGLLMLGTAIPLMMAQALAIKNSAVIENIRNAEAGIDMAPVLEDQRAAASIFPASDILSDLSMLEVAAARLSQSDWRTAEAALRASLAARPVDGMNWARLAYVLDQQNRPREAAEALTQSITTATFIVSFMQWRFSLALKLWPDLNADQRKLVAEQAQLLWLKKRMDFIKLARTAVFSSQIEEIMQAYYPADVDNFLQRRGRLRHTP